MQPLTTVINNLLFTQEKSAFEEHKKFQMIIYMHAQMIKNSVNLRLEKLYNKIETSVRQMSKKNLIII